MRPWRQRSEPNRSRACHCCGRSKYRVHVPWPQPDDPDFVVAICPDCDRPPEKNEGRRT